MTEKPIKVWVVLLVTPIPLIIAAFLLQAFVLFSSPGSDPTFFLGVLSLVALLASIAGGVLLLGIPVWIVMLIRARRHNNQSKNQDSSQTSPAAQKNQPQ